VCCLLLYLGLQIAFIGALNPDVLKNGWHALTFAGDIGPFVGIALMLGLAWLAKLLYIDAAVSPLGAGLIYVTSTARIIYAMSKTGYLPKFLSRLNGQHFPIYSIALNFLVGMFLFLPLPGWQTMVSFLVSAVVISYAMGPISLMCLRRQLPEVKRPFRLPAATIISLLAFYCCNLISYWTGWQTISKLAIAMLIGFGFFIFAFLRNMIPKEQLGFKAAWWVVPYLAGLILISYLGSYGGKQILKFGWDFVVIGIFSIAIFYLAIRVRLGSIAEQFEAYKIAEVE
jgi:amino acid transporter